MKIKEGFILRKIAATDIVVPIGNNIADFNGVITLNETAAFLWKSLKEDCSIPELVDNLIEEYSISEQQALVDVEQFIAKLEESKLLKITDNEVSL